ncbi:MAG: Cytochrome [Subtercola sp.]|nr:Cytochrome [Subtercola sp.]
MTPTGQTEAPAIKRYPFTRTSPLAPAPEFDELRTNDPVTQVELWNGNRAWLATRYEDIRALLHNPNLSSDTMREGFPQANATAASFRGGQRVFARMDPPQHDEHRLMLTADFMVRHVRELRPYLDELIDNFLDDMQASEGPVDLVKVLAQPVPANIITRLLDLPPEDSEFFLERVNTWMSLEVEPAVSAQAGADSLAYFDRLITSRLESTADDLVSRLIRERLLTGQLSRAELQHMLGLILVGGFDTTANMIALGTLTFIQHPDQLQVLLDDPSLLPNAVEELLRYLTVAHHVAYRIAAGPIEIAGRSIREGDGVIAPLMAANYDPEVFPSPHTFDIQRDARGHLAFGYGVHQCLGQALARVELQAVFGKLFQRLPNIRLAVPENELRFKDSLIYGVVALPVTW